MTWIEDSRNDIHRRTAGYSLLDHRRNDDILEKLKADPVENKLPQYKQKLLNHVSRLEDIRCPKQLLDYRSTYRKKTWTTIN